MTKCDSPDLKEWINLYKEIDSSLDDYSSYAIWNYKPLRDEILRFLLMRVT